MPPDDLAFSKASFIQGIRLLLIFFVGRSEMVPDVFSNKSSSIYLRIYLSIESNVFIVHFHVADTVPGSTEGLRTRRHPTRRSLS